MTPGDAPDVLVAMNPAALKSNLSDLPGGGLLILDSDEFTPRNLAKVGYATNPLEDGSLEGWQTVPVPLTSMTLDALADSGLGKKEAERSKNMFTLGLLSWMYHRPTEGTVRFLERQFRRKPEIAAANIAAFRAGYNYGETTEAFAVSYEIKPAPMDAGTYRNISGNQALALGIVAAGQRSGLPIFLGAYPITPASDILHELSKHKAFGVRTFQAEDEIAGIGAALGASFGGALGVTTTSGPGVALKAETIGLAVMTELPLLIIDVQRGGPSTGLPTKTEQSDLLQAMFGRNGEAPLPVIAPRSPGDCFDAAIEATRIALTYRTPVMLLSDGYLANGAEPWAVPDVDSLPDLTGAVGFATGPNAEATDGSPEFHPYLRDPETLARAWAVPGTSGLQHRIGGLEKADGNGNISYDPANHDFMVRTRQAKIDGIAASIGPTDVEDPDGDASVAVIGWGSTYGPIGAACRRIRASGRKVAQIHLRHINPFPTDLGEVLARYDRVICPEMNLGQLALLLRAQVPGRRAEPHPGERDALPVRRAGRGHPGRHRHHEHRRGPGRSRRERSHAVTTLDTHVHDLGMPGNPISAAVATSVAESGEKKTDLKAKDLKTDQEVRWCPGCGDYVILNAVQSFLPSLGIAREDMVIISGIGCSSRFPYYMNTYGMHSIHGRAPAIATGLAASRPDLSVWVVTGDGDSLSIGGNHLIHALRRNVNMTILLFNNRIYGLTKGQYSPTSEVGKVTKSTPMGSIDAPFNPISLALGADATFVGRAMDSDRKGLTDVLRQAAEHQGTSLVEIYQNCNIFNDGAFELLKDPTTGTQWSIPLEHGKPLVFGPDGAACVVRDDFGGLRIAETNQVAAEDIVVHDATRENPAYAFALSRLSSQDLRYTPMGVFRSVQKPTYDGMMTEQLDTARVGGTADLQGLLGGGETWSVE